MFVVTQVVELSTSPRSDSVWLWIQMIGYFCFADCRHYCWIDVNGGYSKRTESVRGDVMRYPCTRNFETMSNVIKEQWMILVLQVIKMTRRMHIWVNSGSNCWRHDFQVHDPSGPIPFTTQHTHMPPNRGNSFSMCQKSPPPPQENVVHHRFHADLCLEHRRVVATEPPSSCKNRRLCWAKD